ncbi:hypothetical protein DENSPDRAFT_872364 [Dentipellis sp. KUC8613]|nr:hypothetical protein DENSPDRAFT_872364 [Dentipellis sp. KUC8613]
MFSTIRAPRSTRCTVNHLPYETLGKIFAYVPREEGFFGIADMGAIAALIGEAPPKPPPVAHRTAWQNNLDAPSWTDVLFVCRRWRRAALLFHPLWTTIDTHNPNWAMLCIQNSGNLPLKLKLQVPQEEPGMGAAKLIAQLAILHYWRLEDVTIVSESHHMAWFILQLFSMGPAPILKSFAVECKDCESAGFNLFDSRLFSGAGGAPNLRRLRLATPHIQWMPNSYIFQSLTHVDISNASAWRVLKMGQFVACIGAWTRLRVLALNFSLPTENLHWAYPFPPPLRTLALPHLEKLRFTDDARLVDFFLSHLVLPESVSLALDCIVCGCAECREDVRTPDGVLQTQNLLSRIHADLVRQIRKIEVTTNGGIIELAAYTKTGDERFEVDEEEEEGKEGEEEKAERDGECRDEEDKIASRKLHLRIGSHHGLSDGLDHGDDHDNGHAHGHGQHHDHDHSSYPDPRYFLLLFTQLTFPSLRVLDLGTTACYPASVWTPVLRATPHLTDLCITSCGPKGQLDGLIEVLAGQMSADARGVIVPALRYLSLDRLVLDNAAARRLVDCVVMRHNAGAAMKALYVTERDSKKGKRRMYKKGTRNGEIHVDKRTYEMLEDIMEDFEWQLESSRGQMSAKEWLEMLANY